MTRRQRQIINAVSAVTRIPVADLIGRRRYTYLIPARQAAQYLMVSQGGLANSTAAVGRVFGRDHTSVLWSIIQVKRDLACGGPRAGIVKAVSELIIEKDEVPPAQPPSPKQVLHRGAMPHRVRSVTKAGWIEADGSLVVAP